ncbi:MAG: hypothetical protein KFF72_13505 [Arthrospira sp. SH-MAG29]|nr:hypothetical protein [Arthrospira sp. SH-MAG29]MBS0017342.1 hypothetical protein [Arthrospira sp. SH-MAG29]
MFDLKLQISEPARYEYLLEYGKLDEAIVNKYSAAAVHTQADRRNNAYDL